ncbi:MAG: DUF2065 domain-containing protein [Sneathiella sp.]|uniref:DUF2065 domain-containing protein n=1 Tax=Sneathiella sp. TaxID=1964365 RepID=UPI0030039995
MLSDFILAGALILFIEGALYALFPDGMKKMMISVLETPSHILRIFGLIAAIAGVAIVWVLRG